MGMDNYYYVGYYFLCPKRKDVDPYNVFPNEEFCRVYDEGGSDINEYHVYLPNRTCPYCYNLDKWSKTGFIGNGNNDNNDIPEMISKASEILTKFYDGKSEMKYGILCYCC